MILSNLANVLRGYGLTVVETPGWATRGYAGQDLQAVRGVLWHHTATGRSAFERSEAPTLNLCINGRSDLPGPLCQIVFGRNGTVFLTAAGVSNHAGRGIAPNIPENMGNHYLIGIEMESSGVAPFDWTDDQKRVAPYLGAALELGYLMHLPPELRLQIGHKEYSYDGKIDPAGWPGDMNGLRDQINQKIAEIQAPAPTPIDPPHPVPATAMKYEADPHWTMEKDENLGMAARHFGVGVVELARYNGIKDPNKVEIGERIWPPVGADTYVVDPKDTLTKIVAFYHSQGHKALTVQKIQFANGINDPATETKVGLRLQIPK